MVRTVHPGYDEVLLTALPFLYLISNDFTAVYRTISTWISSVRHSWVLRLNNSNEL